MNTLIKNVIALLPDGTTPLVNIAIADDRIVAVGDVPEDFQAEKIIDGTQHFAIPGFVNAHTHASMTLLRSYADDMKLMDWLEQMIWPIEAKLRSDDIYWGAMLAAVEMIRSGTTAFADMYGPDMERVAEVVDVSGLRGVLSRGLIGVAPDSDKKLEENAALYENYHGAAQGRITVMFGPHALYTCPPDYLKKIAAKAQALGAEVHIHMSETVGEIENCLKEYGKRPFAHVASTGLFENGTLAAHCVHLDDEDIDIIKKYHIRVAHNPGSNMKLASGTAPVPRLLEDGVCVALGTDGASSNNNLDMLDEVQLAALMHKVHTLDPLAVPALTAVKMGTEYGAQALSLHDVGRLRAGDKADIVLFSMRGAAWTPCYNPVSLLAYAAKSSSIDTVMVDGKILMENGALTTMDEERILFEAQKVADRLTK
ncbi:amidohydrolase [Selenomonas dianae]|uniref:5-methylthioadenosine/S-adenosylhomocysteine deaminase n=1 Tax=Selenomonas dianae TaxID=135079 RepID=A0ABP3CII7_9FIRM|nr:amidohydrolase [Selenomonas dianae]WLD83425.1 amidohydrolase [Selenomonas dianae]